MQNSFPKVYLTILFTFLILIGCTPKKINRKGKDYFLSPKINYQIRNLQDSLVVTITNNSDKNYFLFSSYLDNTRIKNKYLYRYDYIRSIYKYSFIPITPYVNSYVSDKLILVDKGIFISHQVKYKFREIQTKDSLKIAIPKKILCEIEDRGKVTIDFDVNNFNINQVVEIENHFGKSNRELHLEFAIYETVDILLKLGAEYTDSNKFSYISKNYKTEIIKINYNHILLCP